MNQPFPSYYGDAGELRVVRNRVLRNTFWLLALSMVPTVLGAALGVQMHFSFFAGSPFIGFMVFMAVAFGFFWVIERTKNSAMGVVALLGFTFFMGLMLSRMIEHTLHFANGAQLIMTAFGGTGLVFATMASVATTSKRDFSGLSSWLFAGVIVILLAGIANIWLQMPVIQIVISIVAVAIFSAYILFDVQRIVNGGETNYITATLAIYLDVYNVFVNLLALLGIFGGERD